MCFIVKIHIIYCVPVQIFCFVNFFFRNVSQNSLNHSDCRIFKSRISPEQIDEIASFLYVDTDSQDTISQERTDGTNWFFTCWYNFTQKWVWSWSKMSMVRNGCGQSGDGTLKLTVFEEWTDGVDELIFYMLIHDRKN